MCFISFGSIIGPIDVSDGTIFDVYLFSDCLNEYLLFFSFFFAKSFQSIPNMLEQSCIWVEQILKVWKKNNWSTLKRQQKSFLFIFFARGVTLKCLSGYPTTLFLLLENMAGFGLRLYNFTFCFIFF